jgi:hypothetical protein
MRWRASSDCGTSWLLTLARPARLHERRVGCACGSTDCPLRAPPTSSSPRQNVGRPIRRCWRGGTSAQEDAKLTLDEGERDVSQHPGR